MVETKCHKPTTTGDGMNPPRNMVGLDSEPSQKNHNPYSTSIFIVCD